MGLCGGKDQPAPAAKAPVQTPLFDRLGGDAAVDAAVSLFYQKVVGDAALAPLFEKVDMEKLKAMQRKFLTQAFGGPSQYDGRALRDAHKGKGITAAHFGAVAGHLSATLVELGVPQKEHDEAMAIAASVQGDVVEPPAAAKPLFARIGGDAAVEAAVSLFYKKVLLDDALAPLFERVDMAKLQAMQRKFLTQAFGGPSAYDGRELSAAHKGKGITEAHFASVAGHLSATLLELGVPQAEHDEAMAIAASVKGHIVDAAPAP